MASRLLLWRPTLGIGLGFSAILAAPMLLRPLSKPLLCDSYASSSPIMGQSSRGSAYQRIQSSTQTSSARKESHLNAKAIRQVTAGSIAGLVGGLALNAFSKPLTLLLGLLILGVSLIESRGIHIIPYKRLQRHFRSIDLRSSLEENLAFKLSFGTVFALAAFAEF